MAQVNFDDALKMETTRQDGNNNQFEFFTLKNDGDSAVVRFVYNSTAEFEIFTVHNVNIGGKLKKISCLRSPSDPSSLCPLCESGNSIYNRFFIRMLEYRVSPQGQIIPQPVVWERSMSYATKLKSLMDEYGPLSQNLFKIVRHGAAGSQDTTYDIMFCSPQVYSPQMYPPVENAFNDVKLLGTVIMNKNYQEIQQFVTTGSFPANTSNAVTAAPVAPPQYAPVAPAPLYVPKNPSIDVYPGGDQNITGGYVTQHTSAMPNVAPVIPQPPQYNGGASEPTMPKPTRYY